MCPVSCILQSFAAYLWIFGAVLLDYRYNGFTKKSACTILCDHMIRYFMGTDELGRLDWGHWALDVGRSLAGIIMDHEHTDAGPLAAGPVDRWTR